MNNEKKKITMMFILIATLLFGLVPFILLTKRSGELQTGNMLGILVVIIIALLAAVIGVKRIKDLKQGQPVEDELSKKVLNVAGARSFYMSLYWLLAIMLLQPVIADILFDSEMLDAEQALGGGITGMAIIWFLNWLYYQKKGVN
ncbi:hypothetical protein HOE31_02990 [bacterium]|jgi:hypothetical protein|nr:hypothetical protein [bacterium]MBT4495341.1 hypothetical protein [bacterium]MBT4763740.1 hypothetical protein [bacterium]MBT5401110.1 hypothetical protein [bacterium]MBT5942929.1 hypothetical protein [bacterium]